MMEQLRSLFDTYRRDDRVSIDYDTVLYLGRL